MSDECPNAHAQSTDLDLADLAARTDGCCGSDLKELCRLAAMAGVRDLLRASKPGVGSSEDAVAVQAGIRPLTQADLVAALGELMRARLERS